MKEIFEYDPILLKLAAEANNPLTIDKINDIEAKLIKVEKELAEYKEILAFARKIAKFKRQLMN